MLFSNGAEPLKKSLFLKNSPFLRRKIVVVLRAVNGEPRYADIFIQQAGERRLGKRGEMNNERNETYVQNSG